MVRGDFGVCATALSSRLCLFRTSGFGLPASPSPARPELLAEQAPADGVELELDQQLFKLRLVGRLHLEGFEVNRARRIAEDGGQAPGEQRLLAVGLQRLLRAAGQFAGMGQQVVQRTILADELDGRLLADAGHAGDVVRGIAHECQHIHDLFGALDAPARQDLRHAENFRPFRSPGRLEDERVRRHKLAEVFVRRDHVGLEAFLLGALHQRADEVVGLVAVAHEHRDVEGLEHAPHVRERRTDVFGHFLAVRLIVGELDVALRGRRGVEGDADVGGLLVLEDVEQRLGESVERGGVHAFGREDGASNEREVRSIHQRHAVQQEQFLRHAKSLTRGPD